MTLEVSYIQINCHNLYLRRCIRDFMAGPGLIRLRHCQGLPKFSAISKNYRTNSCYVLWIELAYLRWVLCLSLQCRPTASAYILHILSPYRAVWTDWIIKRGFSYIPHTPSCTDIALLLHCSWDHVVLMPNWRNKSPLLHLAGNYGSVWHMPM